MSADRALIAPLTTFGYSRVCRARLKGVQVVLTLMFNGQHSRLTVRSSVAWRVDEVRERVCLCVYRPVSIFNNKEEEEKTNYLYRGINNTYII